VGPIANFHQSLLSATFQSGLQPREQDKVCRGQIWRVGWLGDNSRLVLPQKFTDEEQRVSRRVVMVQHPGLISTLQASSFALLPSNAS
jgi:hypothetical protein